MPQKTNGQNKIQDLVDRKLILRLYFYAIIFILLLIGVAIETVMYWVNPLFGLLGILLGTIFGVIVARIHYISWDSEGYKVIGRIDLTGFLMLFIYILVTIYREVLFSRFVHGEELTVFTLAFVAGNMLGRGIGMRRKIRRALRNSGILDDR